MIIPLAIYIVLVISLTILFDLVQKWGIELYWKRQRRLLKEWYHYIYLPIKMIREFDRLVNIITESLTAMTMAIGEELLPAFIDLQLALDNDYYGYGE